MKYLKKKLSKYKYLTGYSPTVVSPEKNGRYIPKGYQGVLTITADFELAWAARYSKQASDSLSFAKNKAAKARSNIPKIISLSEKFNIPITWATVGHLFLKSCNYENGKKHPDIVQLSNFENEHWRYNGADWFEYDPASSYKHDPEWYAPDLIEMIVDSPVNHEIGCHTFSHIDCTDEICPPEVLNSELKKSINEASKFGINMKSFVHPGHTLGNYDTIYRRGFTSYQSDPGNVLAYPCLHKSGLWELKRTFELRDRFYWSKKTHINVIKKIIDKTVRNNMVCNFWFHPSTEPGFVNDILPSVLEYINEIRNELFVCPVGDYIQYIKDKNEA